MVDLTLYGLFIAACAALALMPGPNVAMIVANSLAYGARYGLMSVAGASSAMIPQLLFASVGTAALVSQIANALEVIRWLGVVYLFYLAFMALREKEKPTNDAKADATRVPYLLVFKSAFGVSLINPKTLMFLAAFFPQFLSADKPILGQMIILSVTYIIVVSVIDCGWALLAAKARRAIKHFARFQNKIIAGVYGLAGLGLAFARKGS